MGIDREDAAEHWPGLSEQAISDIADLGVAPTVHVADRQAKGWRNDADGEGSYKFYVTADDLRKKGASYIEAADWLDRRAGVQPAQELPPLVFSYTNWRGEHGTRRAIPIRVYHGATEYHPEPQWLMEARDLDKGTVRVFAMRDMGPAQGADIARELAEEAVALLKQATDSSMSPGAAWELRAFSVQAKARSAGLLTTETTEGSNG